MSALLCYRLELPVSSTYAIGAAVLLAPLRNKLRSHGRTSFPENGTSTYNSERNEQTRSIIRGGWSRSRRSLLRLSDECGGHPAISGGLTSRMLSWRNIYVDDQMVGETETPALPQHINSAVAAIAHLHAEHRQRATPVERFIERLTAKAGKPTFLARLTFLFAGWIAINLLLKLAGYEPLDPPPFAWLEGAASVAALYVTFLILSTHRRDDELASHRDQLTLQLAIMSDQKAAKIIQLLEEIEAGPSGNP